MTENTVSTPGAANPGPGQPPEPKATTADGDAVGKGFLDRIAGLTAERDRKDTQIAKLEKQIEEERKKHQSDDEKRMEALADAKYGDKVQRLDALVEHLTAIRDEKLKAVPAEYAAYIDSNAPVERQIQQIETLFKLLSDKKMLPATGAPGTPASTDAGPLTREGYNWVTSLASSSDPKDREEYEKHWPAYRDALKAGKFKLR